MEDFEAEVLFDQARNLLEQDHDSKAEMLFSQIIDTYPDWEGAYGNRGLARMRLGHDEMALEDFRRVVELDPEDAMAYARIAEALRNLGRHLEALEMATKALEIDSSDPDAYYIRGWLFFYCGQYASAIEDFETFIKLTDEPGEVCDMQAVAQAIIDTPQADGDTVEKLLRENGFSKNTEYNDSYLEEDLFCPYAHCVRMRPMRGEDAADVCPVTGFSCPGDISMVFECSQEPFELD